MKRGLGVLLHISSLPSAYGIGTLGQEALNFIDFLADSGVTYWQILPISPTSYGDSPYQSCSAFAGNHYFIDLDILVSQGLLTLEQCGLKQDGETCVNYEQLYLSRINILKLAFMQQDKNNKQYAKFIADAQFKDYALFMTLKNYHKGLSWNEWQLPYRNRDAIVLQKFSVENAQEIEFWQFTQYLFFEQFASLKNKAKQRGITIVGDIPIYVAYDSVDVWSNRNLFKLKRNGKPSKIAGVPPDAFSEDGQLWGNPIYRWNIMKKDRYSWFMQRMDSLLKLVDVVRIDHFRGFDRYFEIDFGNTNAKNGVWRKGPSLDIIKVFHDRYTPEQLIAEDLGFLDDSAKYMFKIAAYPGMKILQFAFDGNITNDHLPEFYTNNCIVYTGTHDNETVMQSLENKTPQQCEYFYSLINQQLKKLNLDIVVVCQKSCIDALIAIAAASVANVAIIPLQDLLHLGKQSRMNLPSTLSTDNWSYRAIKQDFSNELGKMLNELCKNYNR